MEVGIVAQKGNDRAAALVGRLDERLGEAGVTTRIDAATAEALGVDGVDVSTMDDCDLVVSVGGDGTFLFAARGAGATPILGVNLGEVGFLNAVSPEDAVEATLAEVERFRASGTVQFRDVPRVRAVGDGWSLPPALNEIAIMGARRGHGNGADIEVRIGGETYAASHADGVLVATPTGSTAYNLSEGGPLVQPGVPCLLVTQMVAADPMPPLAVDLDSDVAVRVDGPAHAVVSSDGRRRQVETPAVVDVTLADEPGRLAGPDGDFFAALEKLE
jgi:NAD+ kinase